MNVNWNVFFSEYDDQQVSTFVGLGFVVANAASTEIKGLEVDIAFQATENLRLGAAFAYLDGNYDEFTGAGCTAAQASAILALARAETGGGADGDHQTLDISSPVTSVDGCTAKFNATGSQSGLAQDLSDKKLTSAEYTGAITVDYVRPIRDGMEWFASVDIQFTDDYLMTGDLDPIDSQKGFENINVRAGIRSENWGLVLYGRNVSDKLTASGAADMPLADGSHF